MTMEEEANTLSLKNLKKLENSKKFNKEIKSNGSAHSSHSPHVSDYGGEINSNKSGSNLTLKSGSSSYKTGDSFKTVSSNQSIMSFLTIHSKAGAQTYNEHWIERAAERGDLDLENEQTKVQLF